jgi:D-glycero-D-manno-heptose 1,7-bisphosphate phosphatase
VLKNKAVFLDRDGTIIHDGNYMKDPSEIVLLPRAQEAMTLLRDAGFILFLFTNQSGIGRGYFTIDAVHRCNERMLELLGLGSPLFVDVCIAPEKPDEPAIYRKPSPRFINESIAKHGLDPAQSWMVGDKPLDVESGLNAGINAALVGPRPLPAGLVAPVYPSLFDFAQAVTGQAG